MGKLKIAGDPEIKQIDLKPSVREFFVRKSTHPVLHGAHSESGSSTSVGFMFDVPSSGLFPVTQETSSCWVRGGGLCLSARGRPERPERLEGCETREDERCAEKIEGAWEFLSQVMEHPSGTAGHFSQDAPSNTGQTLPRLFRGPLVQQLLCSRGGRTCLIGVHETSLYGPES